ncbi:hypothetical protein SPECIALG_302 [Erwinia phage vB_EamM_Special G]|uniref:Uncharacterized protein n=1 Tax=Erwinia phage vB_EamM_Special G TaxID=1815989 RepID=A0A191ZCK4_9CAUD|nr:hypothetical protein FDI00_gp301 [Erwinia phage vB_EamM_Special G]ANJ65113.1 hypothetical protein SPECIALG_302 [Erwinia phage vB_EamM_Special G]
MSIQAFLNLGAEAFEDAPVVEEAPVVVVAPVPEEVIELIAERDDSNIALAIAQDAAAMSAAERQVEEFASAIERVENVQASMEHFIEAGLSQKSAMMLHRQITTVMASVGKDGAAIGGGLENFDNEEASIALLTAGLEALDAEKADLSSRAGASIAGIAGNIKSFLGNISTQAGRYKLRAEAIVKSADGAEAKSGTVEVKDKHLVVKGGNPSTNLKGDLGNFSKLVGAAIATFIEGDIVKEGSALAKAGETIIKATTADVAVKAAMGVKHNPFPGATIAVQDKDTFSIKRTEVVLGGYAVFDLQYKATGGEGAEAAVAHLNALSKNRVTLRQAPVEAGSEKVFSATMSPADGAALAKDVIAMLDNITAVNNRSLGAVSGALARLGTSVVLKGAVAKDADKDVKKIAGAMGKTLVGSIQAVNSLPRDALSAALKVSDAVLKVAKKAAAGQVD